MCENMFATDKQNTPKHNYTMFYIEFCLTETKSLVWCPFDAAGLVNDGIY